MAPAATSDPPLPNLGPVFNIDELLNPAAFAHEVRDLKLQQTHISWVILTGEYAYKIKKRLKLEFLDTTALATRRFLCDEELRLNKRLAPGLYLEVIAITCGAHGLQMGGTGIPVDYAVKMRQFEPSQELPALLDRGTVTVQEIAALADSLAAFHRRADAAPADAACDYAAQLRNCVLGNLATLLAHLASSQDVPAMGQLIDWTHDSLHELQKVFAARQAGGFIRECHGDLHAHNIVRWQGRLTPFDCLEFDPKLRFIDVMNDIAFLVMDLVAHDHKDLAYEFLSRYVEQNGDYQGIRLLPFYAVYRALVRAMVDALSIEQRSGEQLEWKRRLHSRIATALKFAHPEPPSLFIMHGPSGSGKSWLSERLIPLVGAVRLRSDPERKRLASQEPVPGTSSAGSAELYTQSWNRRTYARLLECAENCLQGGISVIVDAAFLSGENRQHFRALADRLGASFVIISCLAENEEMARRIGQRALDNADPSDATVTVLNEQLRECVPLQVEEMASIIQVNTMQPYAERAAFAMIQAREANTARNSGRHRAIPAGSRCPLTGHLWR